MKQPVFKILYEKLGVLGEVFKFPWSGILVLITGLFSGIMLQNNWFFLMKSQNFEKSVTLQYVVLSPIIAFFIFGGWIGFLRLIRPHFSQEIFHKILKKDAYSMLALLALAKVLWAPPLTSSIAWWILGGWCAIKFALYPKEFSILINIPFKNTKAFIQEGIKGINGLTKIEQSLLLIGMGLWLYVLFRASTLAFTYDESLTYTMGVYQGRLPQNTNNHFLNTVLMILSSSLFGNSELALRLPNVLAHILYLISSFLLFHRFQNKWLIVSGFLAINVNPYILDFFSLARGYGLALGFMMCSILAIETYCQTKQEKYLSRSFLFASLSVLAHLAFLNYYLSLFAIVWGARTLEGFHKNNQLVLNVKQIWSNCIVRHTILWKNLFILFIFITPIIANQIKKGQDKYGFFKGFGSEGFWQDTVDSLIDSYLYGQNYWENIHWFFYTWIFLIILGSSFILLSQILNRSSQYIQVLLETKIVWIMLLCSISTILQNYLFDVQFLVNRTGVFFIPLFFLSFFEMLRFLEKHDTPLAKQFVRGGATLLILGVVLHSIFTMNVTFTHNWKFDADTGVMLKDLAKMKDQGNLEALQVNVSELLYNPVSFYKKSQNLSWLDVKEYDSQTMNLKQGFYFLTPKAYLQNQEFFTPIKTYQMTNNILVKYKTL